MILRIKRMTDTAVLPCCQTKGSAAADLYIDSVEDVIVAPHKTVMVGCGWAFEIPEGYFGAIYARSGLSTKMGVRPSTCVSVIDSDYRGEVKLPLHNDTDTVKIIKPFERVAQLIVQPYLPVEFTEADQLSDTERGAGGFGSTGR